MWSTAEEFRHTILRGLRNVPARINSPADMHGPPSPMQREKQILGEAEPRCHTIYPSLNVNPRK